MNWFPYSLFLCNYIFLPDMHLVSYVFLMLRNALSQLHVHIYAYNRWRDSEVASACMFIQVKSLITSFIQRNFHCSISRLVPIPYIEVCVESYLYFNTLYRSTLNRRFSNMRSCISRACPEYLLHYVEFYVKSRYVVSKFHL